MLIEKRNSPVKKDKGWFEFASALSIRLFSDYVSLKLICHLESTAFIPTNFVWMVEVVEKSLKLFLAMHEKSEESLSRFSTHYAHNLEKLRASAEEYNEVFADEDIKQFTKPFDDKKGALYQHLRYGSQSTTDGFKTQLGKLYPIVDKIFYNCILRLEDGDKAMINGNSLLYFIVTKSDMSQINNHGLVFDAIQSNASYFTEYVSYCHDLEKERKVVFEQLSRNDSNK